MRIFLNSIGCRLNQSEMETLGRQLHGAGHEVVRDAESADTVVLNTCAVTRAATRETANLTRRLHRANPHAAILLTGCHATLDPQRLETLPGVQGVVPNSAKSGLLQQIDPALSADLPVHDREPILREARLAGWGNTRAFVKVQDGCNNRCTFCVTTIARGAGQSRPMAEVVAELQALSAAGYREAVLTGVHLGSYGRDFGSATGLRDLVQTLLDQTGIERLRLSSLEPWDIPPGFFELWRNPRLLPHLHLPLQSGCDATLRRMARRTSQESFAALVAEARAHIPDLAITTDLICGFPGEDEAEFATSLGYVADLAFSRLHVFSYSARPGTAAATMPRQVPPAERKERTRRMIALGEQLATNFHHGCLGQTRPVLWEMVSGADDRGVRWSGYSDNYIRVTASGSADLHNRITPTRLAAAALDGMGGEIETETETEKGA
jgi:threonylcarbamoyladenosine tRNA methylthiotransferase MtaB